jgi:multiple sugar transport system permease protein
LENYEVTIFGHGDSIFDSRKSILDSIIVSLSSSLITVVAALPPAYAFSKMHFRHSKNLLYVILFQRFIPPITLVIPLVVAYNGIGMLDRKIGVSFAHAALNMPFAILLVKSFFDDIPKEVAEAAKIDGATGFQIFTKICVPLIKGGIVTTAILAFIFSWIEFMLALFLTFSVRLVPVQAAILGSSVWGIAASLTTAALIPVFIFLMMAQKHLVRGMTMGMQK